MRVPEIGHGTLRFKVDGGNHRMDLSSSEVRAAIAAVRNCRRGTYQQNRALNRTDAHEAARLVSKGRSPDEVALRMGCSPESVMTALRRVMAGRYDDESLV